MTMRRTQASVFRAHQRLELAVLQLAAEGRRPRCGDAGAHEVWLSEKADVRELAVQWCAGCPVLQLCDQAADAGDERFGVWAGVDRTPRPRTSKRAKAPSASASPRRLRHATHRVDRAGE